MRSAYSTRVGANYINVLVRSGRTRGIGGLVLQPPGSAWVFLVPPRVLVYIVAKVIDLSDRLLCLFGPFTQW